MKTHISTQFSTSTWSGGSTTELLLIPSGGSYAERRFDLRLSCASVEKSPSDFTPLPGYKRFFTPLENPLHIMHTDIFLSAYLQPYDLYAFNGTDAIRSEGSGRDFNVIYKPELNPRLSVFREGDTSNLTISPHALNVFFTLAEGRLEIDGQEIKLPAFSLCRLETSETEAEVCAVCNTGEHPLLLTECVL